MLRPPPREPQGHWEDSADALVKGFGSGDLSAHAVIETWIRAAAAPFRLRLGDDWADLLQEVQVELLQKTDGAQYPAVGALRRYVAQLTVHRCIDRTRRTQRWQFEPLAHAEEDTKQEQVSVDEFLRLRTIVAGMPALCRQLWRDLAAGFSYTEMAERHQMKPGTLRVRVLRCRESARQRMQKLEAEPATGSTEATRVSR